MLQKDYLRQFAKEVVQLSKSGVSNAKIAKEFKVHHTAVTAILQENGMISKFQYLKTVNPAEDFKDEIVKRFEAGESIFSIGREIGVSDYNVNRLLKSLGYDTSRGCTARPDGLLKDKKDEIIKLYVEDKLSTVQIAKIMNCSDESLRQILKQENLMRSLDNLSHNIDMDYFKKIDTPNKAYVLGMIYSDGCVGYNYKEGRYTGFFISLKYDDKQILEDIKKDMRFTGDLCYDEKAFSSENSQPQYSLKVSKQSMAQDLCKLGATHNKTWKIRFPTEEQVPKKFWSHFIRGFVDGDGSVAKESACLGIVGNKHFIESLAEKIPFRYSNIYYKQSTQFPNDPDKQSATLRYHKINLTLPVLYWLYGNCQPYLYMQRKYDLAHHWLNKYGYSEKV